MKFKHTLLAAAMTLLAPLAQAQTPQPFRIGALVDMSGVYSAHGGPGMVTAVQMAVEDFGGKVLGRPIEVLSANYQNKVDIAAASTAIAANNAAIDSILAQFATLGLHAAS